MSSRSGLQQDVINLYRQGVRNAMSKPRDARDSFLLHLRYNFRNPELGKRDYSAIEHQLRRMSRTLEMLSDPSVSRLAVSNEMTSWWSSILSSARASFSSASSSYPSSGSSSSRTEHGKAGWTGGQTSLQTDPITDAISSETLRGGGDAAKKGGSQHGPAGVAMEPGSEARLQTDQAADAVAASAKDGTPVRSPRDHRSDRRGRGWEERADREQWHGTLPGHGGT